VITHRQPFQHAAVTVISLLAAGCNPCGNEIVQDLAAPGGQERAILFYRSCGAMGPGGFQVSILPAGRQLANDRAGNVFDVAKKPTLTWQNDSILVIDYPPDAEVGFQAIRLRHVGIRYVPPIEVPRSER
jgi:hypothetical protein